MPKELSRNQLNEKAAFALYDILTYQDMKEEANVEEIISSLLDVPYKECDIYLKSLVIATLRHLPEMVGIFNSNMNKWTFDRLNRLEQAILLVSYAHFFYVEDDEKKSEADKGAVINTAVELSKTYLDAKDYKFVNAILDKLLVRDGK